MANTTPLRLQNFIDAATDGNYKAANEIFSQHDSLLHGGIADTEINGVTLKSWGLIIE